MDRREFLASAAAGLLAGACATPAAGPGAPSRTRGTEGDPDKERVLGIGGFFFRARDPQALASWYATHLGIELAPASYAQEPWRQEAGPTVFAPFAQGTDSFGRAEQPWMINFRVRNLDALVRQLRAADISVEVDAQEYPNGVFAQMRDPEGNPVQLWEPRGVAADTKN